MAASHHLLDVLLVPDPTMIDKAISLNAQLRTNYPAGYALDATRIPHVTLLVVLTAFGLNGRAVNLLAVIGFDDNVLEVRVLNVNRDLLRDFAG